MAYYDPYQAFRPQQSSGVQPIAFQQPAPMYAQPTPPDPQPMQWQAMGDGGQAQNAGVAGGGLSELLKRFKNPGAAPAHASDILSGHGGVGGGGGPMGHGY